jgi:hypothetical protein
MTPKEKAQELYNKYTVATWIKMDEIKYLTTIPNAKQCALIACDEVIEYLTSSSDIMISVNALEYWQEVKTEIEKL